MAITIRLKCQKWKTRRHYFEKLKIFKTETFWLHCCQSVAARVLSRQYGQANSSLLRFKYLHFTFKYKYIKHKTQIHKFKYKHGYKATVILSQTQTQIHNYTQV